MVEVAFGAKEVLHQGQASTGISVNVLSITSRDLVNLLHTGLLKKLSYRLLPSQSELGGFLDASRLLLRRHIRQHCSIPAWA